MLSLLKHLFIIILILLLHKVYSQDSLSTENYAFESDKVAKEAVSKIVKYTGLTSNFIIISDENINTAIAYLKHNKRYIAYNPKFIEKLNNKTSTNWAAVSVLAHEIGHHLSGHTLLRNSSPGNELIADKFSGFILCQMGASLSESKAALSTIGHEMDTSKHPPKNARLTAIEEGFNEAKALRNINAYEEYNNDNSKVKLTEFVYRCTFKGDNNTYFVDEKDNIIWYNYVGNAIIIGKKKESSDNKYSWIYNYLDNFYGVDHKGKIWKETTYGSIFIVGEVEIIKKD